MSNRPLVSPGSSPTSKGVGYFYGIIHMGFTKICSRCRRTVAGVCLCAVLSSAAVGAGQPPPHAVGTIATAAIGAANSSSSSVSVLVVTNQVTGRSVVWNLGQERSAIFGPRDPRLVQEKGKS